MHSSASSAAATDALPRARPGSHTGLVDAEPELLVDEPVRLAREDDARAEPPAPVHVRHGRWWWGMLALALVMGIGVAAVDVRTRSHESSQVAGCESRLRVATGYVERRLGLVSNYLEPSMTKA